MKKYVMVTIISLLIGVVCVRAAYTQENYFTPQQQLQQMQEEKDTLTVDEVNRRGFSYYIWYGYSNLPRDINTDSINITFVSITDYCTFTISFADVGLDLTSVEYELSTMVVYLAQNIEIIKGKIDSTYDKQTLENLILYLKEKHTKILELWETAHENTQVSIEQLVVMRDIARNEFYELVNSLSSFKITNDVNNPIFIFDFTQWQGLIKAGNTPVK